MKHLLLLTTCLFFASAAAWADDFDGSLPSIPDGSVGSGGADMTSEENDPNATCLDSNEIYTTLIHQMTLSPEILDQCRRLRWNIEKAFYQQEQKLDERKAWTASETGKHY